METYDSLDRREAKRKTAAMMWNILTMVVLLGMIAVALIFLAIFLNPYSSLNPFPPPTMPALIAFPTATATPVRFLQPTWTPSPTLEPTITSTPPPSPTLPPTETPFFLFTLSPTPQETPPVGGMPFVISPGTPVSTTSQAFHPEAGCDWLGVAGQVFDLSGAPVSQQQVQIGGTLAGSPVAMLSVTGMTNAYGSVGFYEFNLGDEPIASNGTLWVQLLDQAGLAMSEKIYLETFDSCDKNLIIVNFKQVR
ncbi:MAG TPA: hypothetical protein VJL34_07360 [Anaerolineales bacterium]|nr:hypothetical protein [Anaerolineales bacterium]